MDDFELGLLIGADAINEIRNMGEKRWIVLGV